MMRGICTAQCYFLKIWIVCLMQHVRCSCASIALAVSSVIVNLLVTASAGINGFGPGQRPGTGFGFGIFFQQKDYFPLISVKVALRYVSVLLKLDENDCI